MYRILYRFLVPGWSAKPLVSAHDRIMGTHRRLECCQRTPDVPAIERLLAARYGYWDDDVPHDDPFPETDETSSRQILTI